MSRQTARRAVQFAVSAVIATVLAACSADMTGPTPSPTRLVHAQGHTAFRDDIQGDTTLCRSGWMVEEGRYICNPD